MENKMRYIVVFALVVSLGFFTGCSDTNDTKTLPENTQTANAEINKVFKKLGVGISSNELEKVLKSSTAHIGLWEQDDLPKVKEFDTQDKLCFYTPKEIIPSSGSNQYYPVDYANIIAVAIDKNKDCAEDNFYAKSLLLLSWKSYVHYSIIKKRDYDILKDPQLRKYNNAIAQAKKLHKPMILVIFDAYYQGNNEHLRKTLESSLVHDLIANNFVYVEYKGSSHLERTQIGSITAVPMTYFFNTNGKLEKEYRGTVKENTQDYQIFVNMMKSMIQ